MDFKRWLEECTLKPPTPFQRINIELSGAESRESGTVGIYLASWPVWYVQSFRVRKLLSIDDAPMIGNALRFPLHSSRERPLQQASWSHTYLQYVWLHITETGPLELSRLDFRSLIVGRWTIQYMMVLPLISGFTY